MEFGAVGVVGVALLGICWLGSREGEVPLTSPWLVVAGAGAVLVLGLLCRLLNWRLDRMILRSRWSDLLYGGMANLVFVLSALWIGSAVGGALVGVISFFAGHVAFGFAFLGFAAASYAAVDLALSDSDFY
ncbi:MAG: hypothetical protein JWQ81_1058 [Amycolatopsis sp.]|uniref:hypothetical protein n=1 Tax=Amycolatopsis sp. TaxID=37632 RepID=UPI00261A7226|nr:hypothetical protein [Amycolatopsis sp.]MCU1680319.1 hypothetical protein [Amycolatopsis sp.]